MHALHQLLRDSLRRSPKRLQKPDRLLVAGDWPDADATVASIEAGVVEHVQRLDDAAAGTAAGPGAGPFDLVLWRPLASFNDALLSHASRLLAERGRLWMLVPAVQRRRLLLDLGRLGFAVLQDLRVDGESLFEIRHDGFIVRAFRPGEEARILELFTPSFHVTRSVEHWRWKYEGNPWGRRLITLAESPEGELAAHYAGYPVPYYLAPTGETLLALQIGDTMTDPRFRRAGRGVTSLLGRCFRHFFASHCDEKIAFNYGFNTGNIRRFNFQFIKGRLARPVDYWRRGAERPAAKKNTYRVEAVRTMEGGRDFDRFFRRVARHYGFLVRRDAAWLRWRYLACPDEPPFRLFLARRGRRLVGWSVFRRRPRPEGDQLLFVDALFDPRHVASAGELLRAALEAEGGVAEVIGWMSPNPSWWRREVESLGFEEAEEPNDLALIYLPFTRPEVERLLPAAYYSLGDGDLA